MARPIKTYHVSSNNDGTYNISMNVTDEELIHGTGYTIESKDVISSINGTWEKNHPKQKKKKKKKSDLEKRQDYESKRLQEGC